MNENSKPKEEAPKEEPKLSKEELEILANEVLQGKRGRGADRKRSLGKNYEQVQKEVIRIRNGK